MNVQFEEGYTDLDSHADQSAVGTNALVVHDHDRPVNLRGYDPSGPVARSLRTVNAALAYDDPETGETVILMVNQAILVPSMSHNLLSTMQLRLNDVKVDLCPKFLAEQPSLHTHAIVVTNPSDPNDILRIPLTLHGVTSTFPTRKPTLAEVETCPQYDLTFDSPEWDPHDKSYQRNEELALERLSKGDTMPTPRTSRICELGSRTLSTAQLVVEAVSQDNAILRDFSNVYHDGDFTCALQNSVQIHSIHTVGKGNEVDAETLSRNWSIGIETARRTLGVTTQRGIRTVLHPSLSRRFRTNDRQLRYRRLPITCFTDTMFSTVKSRNGNTCGQVYCDQSGWCRFHPMKRKGLAHESLSLLHQRDGVPNVMVMDNSKEQVQGLFRKKCRDAGTHVRPLEPYTPWANAAEGAIRELKRGVGQDMFRSGAPKRLWDYCAVRRAYIRSFTAHDIYSLEGNVPEAKVLGESPDITPWALFKWYEWVKFRDAAAPDPSDKYVLGRDLGPAIDYGPALCRSILKENGEIVIRSTVVPLTPDEYKDEVMTERRRSFDAKIRKILGDAFRPEDFKDDPDLSEVVRPIQEPYEDDEQAPQTVPDADDADPDTYDQYVGAEVQLQLGDNVMTGKVRNRKRYHDGTVRGHAHKNPVLDTRTYEVEFPDGQVAEYAANVIAQNMFSQCDAEGNQYLLMKEIVDWRKDDTAVEKVDMYVGSGSNRHKRKTTKGWQLQVEWKDGTTSWERLADLKESNPVEVAEFAVGVGIHDEPAFAWWVPYTLSRRNRIIAAVNKRYHKRTHKFGIEIPKCFDDCVRIDRTNGNTLWQDAVRQEMKKVGVAFRVLRPDEEVPPAYQKIACHLVYDVKMEDFRRKARLVAGGHMTETPATITYASVVSRESVRIALTLAALNDLEVKTADIENAYLTAPVGEKIWCVLGPEFGQDAGKRAIVTRALYGLKSAGASFRNHLADCMRHLGWVSCKADQDVWMKAEVRPSDGHRYYAYALLYVDDILVCHHDPTSALKEIDHYFKMKPGSIADPTFYLGAKLRPIVLSNGVRAWGASASKYIQSAVQNVKTFLQKQSGGLALPKRTTAPFPTGYIAELDISEELDESLASFYQSQVGVLRWCVEIGRIDIITEVSVLASFLAMPRRGHFEALLHVFGYLEKKHNSRVVFDPTYPDIDMRSFQEHDWKTFYGDVKESIPPNAPEPRGKDVDLRLFVDSDHAGDKLTRRSRTGFLIYLNSAPIVWYSKKQATIETSVFGAEFVAMKHGIEALRGLRYKLRMMGVQLSGPSFIYGDNMSVIHNTQRPESVLKKKSNSVCYHAVRESVAMGECLVAHISTHDNPADLCTKIIPGGQKRDHLVGLTLYDIMDHA